MSLISCSNTISKVSLNQLLMASVNALNVTCFILQFKTLTLLHVFQLDARDWLMQSCDEVFCSLIG